MLQTALRVELLTRANGMTVLEVANAFEQWLIESRHELGRLSDRFEGGKPGGRAQSFQSNDQETRAQSIIMAVFTRLVAALLFGLDVDLSGEGSKYVEQFFARVRQAVRNHVTDALFLA
jgi:hypothetical protein